MKIAFYAPMKPPCHGRQSGDRLIARLLMAALAGAGHQSCLASVFRSRDGSGEQRRQERIRNLGARLAERLVRRYRAAAPGLRPELWFTYHVYHKAPDWLGPAVARALDIPYVVAEASFAPKQADGPWAMGHAAARDAIAAADAVFCLNPADAVCVRPLLDDARRLVPLKPFLEVARHPPRDPSGDTRRALAAQYGLAPGDPWLIAVAMMRVGNKLDSYRLLAEALAGLEGERWRLLVVGDGPVRAQVESSFARFTRGRVVFTGALAADRLRPLVANSDLFVWPGVREPIGMAMLEAQAAGVPVVAGDSPGIAAIVDDGRTGRLVPRGRVEAFSDAVAALLRAPAERLALGVRARQAALRDHDMDTASAALDGVLRGLRAGQWP
ncbi:MAG: glycosyltransferase [Gammaproteobacteria bacterium]|nr:glycosyltransferase [Gammaproteobacteria bacterium]NIM74838.1 glycosyltransferase [Gammaproteobacteria bacterium]NIN39270.1 glycosyltransferase [Gammaproteobacteria bacterium]NIO26756.1 glycosyltransferase [Gammaproteobacteria bacterium]NIO67312.1 glycosyltransferase [Gammaproteobacteria bacterium]